MPKKKSSKPDIAPINIPPADDIIKQARHKLWHKGNLEWKLSITQKKINDFFKSVDSDMLVLSASRQTGKSWLLVTYAIQMCLSGPNKIVKYVLPEQKMARGIIKIKMQELTIDCPEELKPKYNAIDSKYIFPNGSEIQLAGSDGGNADRLRGTFADLCLVDEAGFCTDLPYIINSVLIPLTLRTKGKIILSSTVPPDPNHPFIEYMTDAAGKNTLMVKTIYDFRDDDLTDTSNRSSKITNEMIQRIINQYPGGEESPAFQNEYMCRLVYNSKDIVIPEFTREVQEDICIPWQRPAYCKKYVSMDIGFTDLTVVLFGYWDFDNAVLVIEKELVMNGPSMTTDKLASEISNIEKKLWSHPYTKEIEKPYKRVSDNNLIVINDLQRLHGISFFATEKTNKEASINEVRMLIAERKIIINPECKVLIHHIKNTVWNSKHSDFKRTTDGAHGDALMSLTYLVRNIDRGINPYPRGYRRQQEFKGQDVYLSFDEEPSKYEKFKEMYKVKKMGVK